VRLCLLSLILVARSFALTVEGPTVTVCGRQNVYRIIGCAPASAYRWHLEWKGAQGETEEWEGNDNEPALNLVFASDPGPHSLELIAANNTHSNRIAIDAMAWEGPGIGGKAPAISAMPLPPIPVLSVAELLTSSNFPPPRDHVPSLPQTPGTVQTPPDPPAIVSPNTDGVIDLASAPAPEESDPLPNPFRVRYRPRMQVRQISLEIGLVLVGNRPEDASVVINGKLYSQGDLFEGLPIASIAPDTIELRQDKVLLRVPVGDRAITLRLLR
jgi:hypothetical protein